MGGWYGARGAGGGTGLSGAGVGRRRERERDGSDRCSSSFLSKSSHDLVSLGQGRASLC